MSIKKKSSNSLAELLEKTKNITSNICTPEYVEQIANEENILRPYLEPSNLPPNYKNETIEHISSTYRAQYRAHIEHNIEHISSTYQPHIEHISSTKPLDIEHISSTISSTKNNIIEAEKTFPNLSKSQKDILLFIHDSCKSCLSKISANITVDEFVKCCNLHKKSVKTTLRRLEKNKILILRAFKRGRQGWRKYEITESIYQEILLSNNAGGISSTLSSTNRDVCSSYNINTTTNVPEKFQKIDYSPLANFGFDESHIIQIYREYTKNPELALSIEIIQNSINALAFDLKHNGVAGSFKNSPTEIGRAHV